MSGSELPSNRQGFSLVEILIAMTLFAVVMLGLAGSAAFALSQMGNARKDLEYSADVQQVADSLVSVGWNNVTSGSGTVRGRAVSWTATTISPNSQKVTLVVERHGQADAATVYSDTVALFLANQKVQ